MTLSSSGILKGSQGSASTRTELPRRTTGVGGGGRRWPVGGRAERQIRHDAAAARAIRVEDDLVGAREHLFHRLEIDAAARDVGRLDVFVIDLEKARCLAPRLGDGL